MGEFALDLQGAGMVPEGVSVIKAELGKGAWGDQTFHNLSNGAKASGLVTSAYQLLKAADLDWDPEFAPLFSGVGGEQIQVNPKIGVAIRRGDTKETIGIGGSKYTLLPHKWLADLADALVDKGLSYGNAGHKDFGALPFIQIGGAIKKIGKDIKGKDVEVKEMITLLTSHNGKLKAMAIYSANVIVCDNTYAHALKAAKGNGMAIRHTKSGPETLKEAIEIAKMAQEAGLSFTNNALQLLNLKFSDTRMEQLATALIPGESTRSKNQRGALIKSYFDAPGAAPGSAWGAAQAVTYYTSHEIGTRNDTDRTFGLQTGMGNGATMQEKAWWHLMTEEGSETLSQVKALGF